MLSPGRQEGCKVVDPPGVGRDVKDCKRQRTNWSIFISLPNKNYKLTQHMYILVHKSNTIYYTKISTQIMV